jgi:hypothetical protein
MYPGVLDEDIDAWMIAHESPRQIEQVRFAPKIGRIADCLHA